MVASPTGPGVVLGDRAQQLAVHRVEATIVDLEQRQRVGGQRLGDGLLSPPAPGRSPARA